MQQIKKKQLPSWIKKRISSTAELAIVRGILEEFQLETVCKNAHCPNQNECFCRGTATFMIMGKVCTRNCTFCAVKGGTPADLDATEPERLAAAVLRMKLAHAVITSVTRDDLPDAGAAHFADTISAVRRKTSATIEVLVPDFGGCGDSIKKVLNAGCDIFNHNVESVSRLYKSVRPQADYSLSLSVLKRAKEYGRGVLVKSGLMVGLGETDDEIYALLDDLFEAGCDIITIGQYLAPSDKHHHVERFVHPDVFAEYADFGRKKGVCIYAGPFVRSSYNAKEIFDRATRGGGRNPLTAIQEKE